MDAVAPPSDAESFLESRTKAPNLYVSTISFLGGVDLFFYPIRSAPRDNNWRFPKDYVICELKGDSRVPT